jgi:hypothetical protein
MPSSQPIDALDYATLSRMRTLDDTANSNLGDKLATAWVIRGIESASTVNKALRVLQSQSRPDSNKLYDARLHLLHRPR